MRIFISIMYISSPNPMFDHLLESFYRDKSNMWSSIGFGEEITQKCRLKLILHILSGALFKYIYEHVFVFYRSWKWYHEEFRATGARYLDSWLQRNTAANFVSTFHDLGQKTGVFVNSATYDQSPFEETI